MGISLKKQVQKMVVIKMFLIKYLISFGTIILRQRSCSFYVLRFDFILRHRVVKIVAVGAIATLFLSFEYRSRIG